MRPARPLRCETRAGSRGCPSAFVTTGESPSQSSPALVRASLDDCGVGLVPVAPVSSTGQALRVYETVAGPVAVVSVVVAVPVEHGRISLLVVVPVAKERCGFPLWEIRVRARPRIECRAGSSW